MATTLLYVFLTVLTVLVHKHGVDAGLSWIIDGVGLTRSKRDVEETTTRLPNITDMYVESRVYARFATVSISSQIVNTINESLDTTFEMQIPESAFISNFTMVVNGVTYNAKVFGKKQAQEKYDEAKEQGKSAGQIRQSTTVPKRGMYKFEVDVNVGALTDAIFYLSYQELLERRLGTYQQRIVIQPGQIVENLTVSASYEDEKPFRKFSYVLPNDTISRSSSHSSAGNNVVLTASPDKRTLLYTPSVERQISSSSTTGLDGELLITFDVEHDGGGMVIVENDYFVHYLTPVGLAPLDKTVVYIIDISGSMGGRKIEQARDAMIVILDRLNANDYFNIMIFDDSVEQWKEVPVLANKENVAIAKNYVRNNVKSRGSTNINDALLNGLATLRQLTATNDGRANVVVLLTDGDPTAGVTDTKTIRKNFFKANRGLAVLYCLGFGFHMNFEFLKSIAWENGGFTRRIYEDVDAVDQLSDFFLEIKDPVLKNVVIAYGNSIVDPESTTQTNFVQYFDGSEIVVTGKTTTPNVLPANSLSVSGVSKVGRLNFTTDVITIVNTQDAFAEKLWAYKKIKDLIRLAAITDDPMATELALNLSLEYNLVTPLTSFVIVQSDEFASEDRMYKRTKTACCIAAFDTHSPSSSTTFSVDRYVFGVLLLALFCLTVVV